MIDSVNGNNVRLRRMQKMQAKWHQHDDSDEMFVVLEGAIRMEIKSKTYYLKKGDVFVIPSRTMHRSTVNEFAYLMVIDSINGNR